MIKIEFDRGNTVSLYKVGTPGDITAVVRNIIEEVEDLPGRVVIKPNFNNDLMAFTGNSVDLRILVALIDSLRNRRVKNILIAEGFNVGVDRRGINGFHRLRIDRLAANYGVEYVDINKSESMDIALCSSETNISRDVFNAPFLINLCKIKTHAEAVMSCALKNWVGINVGQSKRRMHDHLPENIVRINEIVRPSLVIVDGLIGMEGNGPGDGEPVRMNTIVSGNDAFLIDLVVARLIGMSWTDIPYLQVAKGASHISDEDIEKLLIEVPVITTFLRSSPRSLLARLTEDRRLFWLKNLIRPLLSEGFLLSLAYKAGVIQDVYTLSDDVIHAARVHRTNISRWSRAFRELCPVNFEDILSSANTDHESINLFSSPTCIQCLYCYWGLPNGTVDLEGNLGFLEKHLKKYKEKVQSLFA